MADEINPNEINPKEEYERQERERKRKQIEEQERTRATNHAIPKDATLMQHARGLGRAAWDMTKGVAIPANRGMIRVSRYVKKNYVDPKLAERKALREAYKHAERRARINEAKRSARQKVQGGGFGFGFGGASNSNNFSLGGENQFAKPNKARKKTRWF